jgi:hypothetical protein
MQKECDTQNSRNEYSPATVPRPQDAIQHQFFLQSEPIVVCDADFITQPR